MDSTWCNNFKEALILPKILPGIQWQYSFFTKKNCSQRKLCFKLAKISPPAEKICGPLLKKIVAPYKKEMWVCWKLFASTEKKLWVCWKILWPLLKIFVGMQKKISAGGHKFFQHTNHFFQHTHKKFQQGATKIFSIPTKNFSRGPQNFSAYP